MDQLAFQLYGRMVKDFQTLLGDQEFGEEALKALAVSPKKFREHSFPVLGEVPPYRYKAWWQLSNFLKRYRFANDAYSDEELATRTSSAYLATQSRLASVGPWSARTSAVLREARSVCRQILDEPYDTENYRRFGNRATLKCGLKDAFLDLKLGTCERFTCPTPLLKELQKFLTESRFGKTVDRELLSYRRKRGLPHKFTKADYLTLTQVPKSWKINRGITPLSEFGLYWSHGISGYIEHCLRKHGLDIKRLESQHRILARRYSKSRSHVTADLSSASDSLTRPILNAVLPRRVYTDLRKTFVPSIVIDGREYHTLSCLPMGNGATFPIETLVFYCICKAIGNLLKVGGVYSVYGDDLIYPSRIHTYVHRVFGDLGIQFNLEKTFRLSHFRESCGGDFYHGIDVRPALFPEREDIASGKQELQFLYKVWNALRERWTRTELRSTFSLLEKEIFVKSYGKVYFVPLSFPPTAGFRVSRPPRLPWFYQTAFSHGFENGTQVYHFKCILNEAPPQRDLVHHAFYMHASFDRDQRVAAPQPDILVRNTSLTRHRGTVGQLTVYSARRVESKVLKWVVRRFLKSTSFTLGRCGNAFPASESLHAVGKPRVKRVYVTTWA